MGVYGEPRIVINGQALSDAEAMTIRVALESFASDMSEPDALGDDTHGRTMVKLYLRAVDDIRQKIFGPGGG